MLNGPITSRWYVRCAISLPTRKLTSFKAGGIAPRAASHAASQLRLFARFRFDSVAGILRSTEPWYEQGTDRLGRGWWIVIFPEGTRTQPGSTKRYKTGGPRLAVRTGALAVPIAVNSGECWPKRALMRPGLITVSIGKPIDPKGKTAEEVGALVESWIEPEMRRLAPHRYSGPYTAGERSGRTPAPQA